MAIRKPQPQIKRLRRAIFDPAKIRRRRHHVSFSLPKHTNRVNLHECLVTSFRKAFPDHPIDDRLLDYDSPTYGFGPDVVYVNSDGAVGLIIAEACFGGVVGDGVIWHAHVVYPDGISVHVEVAADHSCGVGAVELHGPSRERVAQRATYLETCLNEALAHKELPPCKPSAVSEEECTQ